MRENEKKLAKIARRCASNEASLIWALFGSFLTLGLIFSDPVMLFIGFGWPMWSMISFALAGFAAYVWYLHSDLVIRQAQTQYNDIMKAKKHTMRKDHLQKLRDRNE